MIWRNSQYTLNLCSLRKLTYKLYTKSNKAIVDSILPGDTRCGLSSTCSRRTEPPRHRQHAQKLERSHVCFRRYPRGQTDRPTDRHTHHNTSQPLPRAKWQSNCWYEEYGIKVNSAWHISPSPYSAHIVTHERLNQSRGKPLDGRDVVKQCRMIWSKKKVWSHAWMTRE